MVQASTLRTFLLSRQYLAAAIVILGGLVYGFCVSGQFYQLALETNTSTQSSGKSKEPDGCGLEDGVAPQWQPYSANDTAYMHTLLECVMRVKGELGGLDPIMPGYRDQFNLTRLVCDGGDVQHGILSTFDNIYMIGDSVMRQQFNVLVCMFDPHVNVTSSITHTDTEEKKEYRYVANHSGGSTTTVIYTPWGYCFSEPSKSWPLLQNEFPAALKNGGENDLIVLNAGHHYRSPHAGVLQDHATSMVQQASEIANRSVPQVFVMEADEETWPTSNGLFSVGGEECTSFQCQCQPLSSARVLGNGTLSSSIDWASAFGRCQSDHRVLNALYPHLAHVNHSQCVPDCYPANWRNDLTRPIFKDSPIHVVPVWRQLVARGIPNNGFPGDCTHKGVDALLEMLKQLFRSIQKAQRDDDNVGILTASDI